MKDFDTWNAAKKKIDSFEEFHHPKQKEVWWCCLGINIGTEIYGKGDDFARPVLVINSDYAENCVVVPLTSKIKKRKYSCIIKTTDKKLHTALIFQIRNVDKRRFLDKMCVLDDFEYENIRKYLKKLWKI